MKRNWIDKAQGMKHKASIEKPSAAIIRLRWLPILFLTGLFIATLMGGCANREEIHEDTYTCPMHPTVISDRPATCPVCGMDLVRKAHPGEEIEVTEDLSRLMKSPNEVVIASIKTIKGEYKPVPVSVDAVGIVTYDTRNIYSIPARVGGRVEKIYLKYEFQEVRKGEKVAEIYSPELLTAQREYLYLIETDAENLPLIAAAKSRLQLLGLTDHQISELSRHREVSTIFAIYAPYDGFLITDNIAPTSSTSMPQFPGSVKSGMDGMGSSASGSLSPSPESASASVSLIKEGNYVNAGQMLFTVVNPDALRIELDLPGAQSGSVNTGDKIELDFGDRKTEIGSVDFVQPFFSEGQNFLKIRAYTKKKFHIGQLVNAKIRLKARDALWVPREAVLDLGDDKVVFIKDHGVLKPKRITTGIRSGNLIEIKSGLASSEEIAANANYLVDSESFIKPVN